MNVIFHTTASLALSLVIFAVIWLINRQFVLLNLKKIIIVITLSCLCGGAFLDIPDHYRTNMNPIQNLAFQFNVGVRDQPANLIKGRDDFSFNVFHNWFHLFTFILICMPLMLVAYMINPKFGFYFSLIVVCFALAWSIHLYFDSFVKQSWICGQLMPKAVIESYYQGG